MKFQPTRNKSLSHAKPYVILGMVLCVSLQVIFWLQLAAYRPRVLAFPLIFAYAQKAIIDLAIFEPPWFLTAMLWLIGYFVLALLLWYAFDADDLTQRSRWQRAALGWFTVELLISALAWFLHNRGALNIE